jgi:DNA-binding transcriptional ArsR family regulator
MTSSPRLATAPPGESEAAPDESATPETALELLSDDTVRTILQAISEAPRPASDLIEICDGSKPTVYRRLNRLEDAGLVEVDVALRADGHHCKEFSTDFERVTLEFGGSGLVAEVDLA